jgi:hypothetical protein
MSVQARAEHAAVRQAVTDPIAIRDDAIEADVRPIRGADRGPRPVPDSERLAADRDGTVLAGSDVSWPVRED